ncbi:MAG: NADAR family protein [Candidatus Heimdallarchaeota archaeon]|nr:NADAR family protein [Candidatus Heimdallarchaeota archaeon]
MAIYFHGDTNPKYKAFSNFYRIAIEEDGIIYTSSEHYYQAQKA